MIEKELLHYDLLFALDKQELLDRLTFQGGTSLRLCYGSQRFNGGSDTSMFNELEKRIDRKVRGLISRELGHSRIGISKIYL